MGIHKDGLNIFVVSEDTKREDMPKEIRQMFEMMDILIGNTVRMCEQKDMNTTLLPSIYLHAFNKVTPLIVDSIMKSHGEADAQMFLDGLKSIVEESFKVKEIEEKA